MKFVYNIVYLFLLTILSPWVVWRIVFQGRNRRGWAHKLLGLVPIRSSTRRCVWLHAVSVGEVNMLTTFVGKFRKQYPDFDVAISTTTETGFDLARKRFPDGLVFFCPTDFSWAVNNTINRINPDILILAELELWPNLISVVRSHQIPVALINGRISEKSFNGYNRMPWLVKRFINDIDVAAVQTETYARRLVVLGMEPEKIHVCGNIKFDNVQKESTATQRVRKLATLAKVTDEDFVFLAGSTQEAEDRMAISIFQELGARYPQLRLILVPRHPERCHRLAAMLGDNNLPFVFRSRLTEPGARRDTACRILIVDVIGELGDWWAIADAGYVGGSMGSRGGQNMIEPAAYGVPISFGPNTENFRDVVELLRANNAALVVENQSQLRQFIVDVLDEPDFASGMGARAELLVGKQRGAVDRTISLVDELLKPTASPNAGDRRAA